MSVSPSSRPEGARAALLGAGLGPALVLALVLTLFVWPVLRLSPHELRLAVAGPPAAAQGVAEALEHSRPGAFTVVAVPDAAAARRAVQGRDAAGALVPGPAPQVLVASAGSPAVATLLTGLAGHLPGAAAPADVQDVAPLAAADPRGAALPSGLLPVLVAGVLLGAGLWSRRAAAGLGAPVLLAGVVAGAGTAGLAGALVLHTWLAALPGGFWSTAWPVALTVAAVGTAVLGAASLRGVRGLGLVAATVVLVGNPLSGATSSPDLLPRGWSGLGQLLPPGAAASLLRGTTAFAGARTAGPVSVLTAWVAAGAVLLTVAAHRRAVPEAAPVVARTDRADRPLAA